MMEPSRRKLLALLGVGGLTGLAGCEQLPIGEEQTRTTEEPQPRPDDPATPHDHVGEQWSGQLASGDGLTMANTATSGAGRGIVGSTAAPDGAGVAGVATDASGENDGVVGRSDSENGTGVRGHATAGSGETRGVVGQADSPDGYGLFTPDDAGVEGFLDVETLGTSRGRTVSFHAGGARALELGPETTGAAGNLIAGHSTNAVAASVSGATIGGGGFDDGETADPNLVLDDFGTVGGGRGNQAGSKDDDPRPAVHATVGGGAANVANGDAATVGGGEENVASAGTTTVGGGTRNVASTFHATVGGGAGNLAEGPVSTISGGAGNEAPGSRATVGGGHTNAATGDHSTIIGGRFNTAEGDRSVVAGGSGNVAEGRSSFVAGRRARAYHDGAVVWSDSSIDPFASTGEDQFLIQAGSVGVGTNAPVSQLHVVGDQSGFASLDNHVMTVENHNSESSPDVLALKTYATDPSESANYVTFLDAEGFVGAIEGNGSGGVNYRSGAGDVAEYFPVADSDETFAPGDVVGLRGGAIVADPTAADVALVVSDAPMVTGNAPAAEGDEGSACVALLGQVPVRVGAAVEAGDLLVAAADGTAVPASAATAVPAADTTAGEGSDGGGSVVGRALEGAETAGDLVRTFVSVGAGVDPRRTEGARNGHPRSMATEVGRLRQNLAERDERIDALEGENETLRERLADLEERVATVEHAATVAPDRSSPPASADG